MAKFDTETFYRLTATRIKPDGSRGYSRRYGPYTRLGDARDRRAEFEYYAREGETVESKIEKLTGTWEEVE